MSSVNIMCTVINVLLVLVLLCIQVNAHSWAANPVCRSYIHNTTDCLKFDNGSTVVDSNNNTICGIDALGTNLLLLRPNTWQQNPCYFGRNNGTFSNAPRTVVQRGTSLCVQWPANAHDTDPFRNQPGGGVAMYLSSLETPTQADFYQFLLAKNVPYEDFRGVKVLIPASLATGLYTFEWFWNWTITPTGSQKLYFISCSDLYVVNASDPMLAEYQSSTYGLGLPAGFTASADLLASWNCSSSSPVFTGDSQPTPPPPAQSSSLPRPVQSSHPSPPPVQSSHPSPAPSGTCLENGCSQNGDCPIGSYCKNYTPHIPPYTCQGCAPSDPCCQA